MEPGERVYKPRGKMLFDNFLAGIVWAIGVWVGSVLIIGVLLYFLSKIDLVPIVGDFIGSVSKYVARSNSIFPF